MSVQLVVVTVEGQRYALFLHAVERVLRAVAVTPLPGAPEIVLGVIDLGGVPIPVLDLRMRLTSIGRPVDLQDMLVVGLTRARRVALLVDSVEGVVSLPAQAVVAREDIVPGKGHVHGLTRCEDGLLLIHDLDRFLSIDEETALDRSLEVRA